MRRATGLAGGILAVVLALALAAGGGEQTVQLVQSTPELGVQWRTARGECVTGNTGTFLADSGGVVRGGFLSPLAAVAAEYPGLTNLTVRRVDTRRAVVDRFEGGWKVAAFRVENFGDGWFVTETQMTTTNCHGSSGFSWEKVPGHRSAPPG